MRPAAGTMDNPVTLTQAIIAIIVGVTVIIGQCVVFVWFLAGMSKDVSTLNKHFDKHCDDKDIHTHASVISSMKETIERVDGKLDRLLEAERKTILRPTTTT